MIKYLENILSLEESFIYILIFILLIIILFLLYWIFKPYQHYKYYNFHKIDLFQDIKIKNISANYTFIDY